MSAEQLIIKHLDIWTSAHKTRSSAGRGIRQRLDLYGIKKLRDLIIQLALSGKLVPQIVTEETPSVIIDKIRQIRGEKNHKVNSKQIFPAVQEDERLFDTPEGWEWVRLGEVVDIVRGITFPSSEKSKEPEKGRVACLRTTNVQDIIEWDDLLYIRNEFVSRNDQFIQHHDIVMSMANSRELVGKVALITEEPEHRTTFGGFLSVIRPLIILPKFLMLFFRNSRVREELIGSSSQTTNIANISLAKLNPFPFVFPSLDEQKNIVAKVDELMALCDELEQAQTDNIAAHSQLVEALLTTLTNSKDHQELQANWQRIAEHFDTLFTTEDSIDQLKQTILQLAVMGKLVPQDPNDEPASELLKKIAAEKAQLIKEGKIKKEKPLPEITDEEKPFDLPRGWAWYRLGDLLTYKQGAQISVEQQLSENSRGLARYLRITDFRSDDDIRYVADMHQDVYCTEDDLLMIRYGGTASEVVSGKAGIFHNNMFRIDFDARLLESSFLQKFLGIPDTRKNLLSGSTSSTMPQISHRIMNLLIIALPPIKEQKRISDKLEELQTIYDELNSK